VHFWTGRGIFEVDYSDILLQDLGLNQFYLFLWKSLPSIRENQVNIDQPKGGCPKKWIKQ
jgi:hypothetical protein